MSDGQILAIGQCFGHGWLFEFDPDTVCTIEIVAEPGKPVRAADPGEPGATTVLVCDPCVQRVNVIRAAMGLPAHLTASEYARRLT